MNKEDAINFFKENYKKLTKYITYEYADKIDWEKYKSILHVQDKVKKGKRIISKDLIILNELFLSYESFNLNLLEKKRLNTIKRENYKKPKITNCSIKYFCKPNINISEIENEFNIQKYNEIDYMYGGKKNTLDNYRKDISNMLDYLGRNGVEIDISDSKIEPPNYSEGINACKLIVEKITKSETPKNKEDGVYIFYPKQLLDGDVYFNKYSFMIPIYIGKSFGSYGVKNRFSAHKTKIKTLYNKLIDNKVDLKDYDSTLYKKVSSFLVTNNLSYSDIEIKLLWKSGNHDTSESVKEMERKLIKDFQADKFGWNTLRITSEMTEYGKSIINKFDKNDLEVINKNYVNYKKIYELQKEVATKYIDGFYYSYIGCGYYADNIFHMSNLLKSKPWSGLEEVPKNDFPDLDIDKIDAMSLSIQTKILDKECPHLIFAGERFDRKTDEYLKWYKKNKKFVSKYDYQ